MENSVGSITGYAANYNVETSIADLFREVVRPGASVGLSVAAMTSGRSTTTIRTTSWAAPSQAR